jgi:hypothetical protein
MYSENLWGSLPVTKSVLLSLANFLTCIRHLSEAYSKEEHEGSVQCRKLTNRLTSLTAGYFFFASFDINRKSLAKLCGSDSAVPETFRTAAIFIVYCVLSCAVA